MRTKYLLLMAPLVAALSATGNAQAVIGEMFASDASVRGSVLFASGGTQIQSGSSLSAGEAPAVLQFEARRRSSRLSQDGRLGFRFCRLDAICCGG